MKEILAYCQTLPVIRFGPGEAVLCEGARNEIVYVLRSGAVEVVKRAVPVALIDDPGAVFGEMSVLLDSPHTATVRAVTATQCYRVDDPEGFLQSNAALCYHVATLMARRVNSVTNYLADIKEQYGDREDHLGMIDEILDTLVHQQGPEPTPGSDRDPV